MTYQLLVSTMHQTDTSIIQRMNIHSDAIIINQADRVAYERVQLPEGVVDFYTFDERGVGLSRNSALMRSTADIVGFADDDMCFVENHRELVLQQYEQHPQADMILFNVESLNSQRPNDTCKRFGRVSKVEALGYGTPRVTVRREKLLYHNISFSLLFGGGARYGCGEDTIFLQHCANAGFKMYKAPVTVATVSHETSTWFKGYTDQYFIDKGCLFRAALPVLCYPYALAMAAKNGRQNGGMRRLLRLYDEGIRSFRKKL